MTNDQYLDERGFLSGRKVHDRPKRTTAISREVVLPATPKKVFDFCLSVEGYSAIMPYRVDMIGYSSEQLEEKMAIAFRIHFMNLFPVRWIAFLEELNKPHRFIDLQTRGMFRYFRHTHTFEEHQDGTRYGDHVEFATRLGRFIDSRIMKPELTRVFKYRQKRMRELLRENS